eukprot:5160268-Amphidinium_carterae.1
MRGDHEVVLAKWCEILAVPSNMLRSTLNARSGGGVHLLRLTLLSGRHTVAAAGPYWDLGEILGRRTRGFAFQWRVPSSCTFRQNRVKKCLTR